MAIIDKVEVTISSGGAVVHEYAVPVNDDMIDEDDIHPDSKKVIKYIEAIPGANFAINYSLKGKQDFGTADYLGFSTWIDGYKMNSPLALRENVRG